VLRPPEQGDGPVSLDLVPFGPGVEVTRLIFGCAPIGGLFAEVSEETAARTLEETWAQGARTFDTAPLYGHGLAEERLGAFFSGRPRQEFVVCTKVGRLLVDDDGRPEGRELFVGAPSRARVQDYSRDGTRRSVEESCERMGLDHVDIALVHDPSGHMDAAIDQSYAGLAQMRSEGTVKSIGVGTADLAAVERFCLETDIDCALVPNRYTLLDTSAAERVFPLCLERGIKVMAAGVYNSGVLADPHPGARYDYVPVPAPVLERVLVIQEICERHGVPIAHAAAQYPLCHPAVTAVVIGARSPEEARANSHYVATAVPSALFDELTGAGLIGRAGPSS
jgi:D-threo-aldose 1-dehydrogenase